MSAATYLIALIAGFSWIRFIWRGFTKTPPLTEQSVLTPLLWTILAVVV